ncbi:MAG: VOC family protein [Planctomycetota bacterium]|nr:VOC family protein [Planctomycetota bacterium]
MNPTPAGWPRISTSIFYLDPAAAIDWLCRAFGFEVQVKIEGTEGRIEHSQLRFGDGLIMVAGAGPGYRDRLPQGSFRRDLVSPEEVGGRTTHTHCLYVDDVDAHCEVARSAGARIASEPETTDYGEAYWADRTYAAIDPEGHVWWFMQRLRDETTQVE